MTTLGSLCPKPPSFGCKYYVYHRIFLDFKYGLRNQGSFVRSQSIQKDEDERTFRTQIKRDVENFKPGRYPVSYKKATFLQAKSMNASEGKIFQAIPGTLR